MNLKRIGIIMFIILLCLSGCKKDVVEKNTSKGAKEVKKYKEKLQEDKKKLPIYITYLPIEDIDQLVEKSSYIFTGKVESVSYKTLDISAIDAKEKEMMIHTIYNIEIQEMYKGNRPDNNFEFKIIGGPAEDGYEYVLVGKPEIEIGERYLFILSEALDKYPELINLTDSVYCLDEKKSNINSEFDLNKILEFLK